MRLLYRSSAILLTVPLFMINGSRAISRPAARYDHAAFAAGCFWGVEAAFQKANGVISTTAGYTGGSTANPTYRDISNRMTGHAEAVLVTYDPARISYAELLDVFWSCHDPTADHAGGPHRSVIFFHDTKQEATARVSLAEVENSRLFQKPIVTEIRPSSRFYPAEEYHQQYVQKHQISGACHVGTPVHTPLATAALRSRGN